MAGRTPDISGSVLRVHGLDLSYFTGKLEAYLRAKGLPYELVEMDSRDFRHCAARTGVAQMPQLEFPDGRWLTDSTAIIEFFEREWPGAALYPDEPAVCFIAHLLEDYADEWLWRPAMYYRWVHDIDARLTSERLARGMMRDLPLPLGLRRWLMRFRQHHLFVRRDGVNRRTAPVVEAVYLDLLAALQTLLAARPFLFGVRPTQADIGFFGPMFRHFAIDPTPSRIMRARAPAALEWVARLWNLQPSRFENEAQPEKIPTHLEPLLAMVCKDYLPYLAANERAHAAGDRRVRWACRGVGFDTQVSPYRVWCLRQLRVRYLGLSEGARAQVNASLDDSAVALLARAAASDACPLGPVAPGRIERPAGTKPLDSQWH